MMPHVIISSGLWFHMRPVERSVYVVLCHFRNYKTNHCFPGIQTICDMSGYLKTSVCKALKKLVVYGIIRKTRAPRGLKFRNIYTIILDPKIDPNTFPTKSEKKYIHNIRNKKGKFKACPSKSETNTLPSKSEALRPSKPEKKENKYEIEGNRDSKKPPPYQISLITLNALREEKGEDWVEEQLKSGKYAVESESSLKVEETNNGEDQNVNKKSK